MITVIADNGVCIRVATFSNDRLRLTIETRLIQPTAKIQDTNTQIFSNSEVALSPSLTCALKSLNFWKSGRKDKYYNDYKNTIVF